MRAYYNEIEPFAAEWLRNLIDAGHIAAGDVDERSIADVGPEDLRGYTQCHFFAGIGVWSHALRLAGWPDDVPVWTGSCPCQPFSVAGAGRGTADARHLWPDWFRLIRECRPATVFGEQVSGRAGAQWLDLVSSDMESLDYAIGAADIPAASLGAPHIRQRLFFVAHAQRGTTERPGLDVGAAPGRVQGPARQRQRVRADVGHGSELDGPGHTERKGLEGRGERGDAARQGNSGHPIGTGGTGSGGMGNADSTGRETCDGISIGGEARPGESTASGPWVDLVWIPCRDGKARPTQSLIQQMADGTPDGLGYHGSEEEGWTLSPLIGETHSRTGRLRAYGNAIVPQVAAAFIRASRDGAA